MEGPGSWWKTVTGTGRHHSVVLCITLKQKHGLFSSDLYKPRKKKSYPLSPAHFYSYSINQRARVSYLPSPAAKRVYNQFDWMYKNFAPFPSISPPLDGGGRQGGGLLPVSSPFECLGAAYVQLILRFRLRRGALYVLDLGSYIIIPVLFALGDEGNEWPSSVHLDYLLPSHQEGPNLGWPFFHTLNAWIAW